VAYLGLGSNLGDREGRLAQARAELARRGAHVLRASSVIETAPFGVTDQPAFLNQVIEVEWEGSARELLEAARATEATVGRRPTYRWGPREIDVDILIFDELTIAEPDLVIPHPGLRERDFVRASLAELRPDILEP
jgi:2-amino-4-hydroxy-6-hydroxymethyldihydropteridine diphosphokinase